MPDGALSDLRVIDLTQGVAGPYGGKLLADFGADVLKVEPPGGDYTRRLGPFPDDVPDPNKSGLFLHLNTGKRSLTLDLSTRSGGVVFRKLLAGADVLLESEPPGQMAERGLGYDDLKAEFPRLIYTSVTPFGQTGPYRGYRGNSLTAMAMSTIMYNTGEPDREPLTTAGLPGEYLAGIHTFMAVTAALAWRDREGAGQYVDVSMAEATAASDEYNAAMYGFQGAVRRRYYSRHVFGYPNDIFPCKDGYVSVIPGAGGFPSPLRPDEISPMALLLENIELDKDPLFLSMGERMLRWRDFDDLVLPWFMEHTAAEILDIAQALRLPFAPVPNVAELLDDAHLKERGFFVEIEHPEAGKLPHCGPVARMSETPLQIGPAPSLGQHTTDVLAEIGYTPEDMGILSDRGVV